MKHILYAALMATVLVPVSANAETSANAGASASAQTAAGASLDRNEVMQIQQALNNEGFSVGRADGVWGPNTASAVQRFQAQHQINASGRIDEQTLDQLGVNLSMNANSNSAVNSEFEERESKRGSTINPGSGMDAATSAENSTSTGSDIQNPATEASSAESRSIGGIDVEVGAAGSGND